MVVGTRRETWPHREVSATGFPMESWHGLRLCSTAAGQLALSTCKAKFTQQTPKPPPWEGDCSQSCLRNGATGRQSGVWLAWGERDPENQVPLHGQGLEMGLLGDSGWESPASRTGLLQTPAPGQVFPCPADGGCSIHFSYFL